jgi:hypothetical protein
MSEFIAPSSDRAFEKAKEQGLKVVVPASNELQIDIDTEEDYDLFLAHIKILLQFGVAEFKSAPSKSGLPKRHVTVTLPYDLNHWQRIALQASLGSDRKREILSCIMVMAGDPLPTIFLEKDGDAPAPPAAIPDLDFPF